MSQRALNLAVRNAIRASPLSYATKDCECMFDGQPPPSCGTIFAAVHSGTSRNQSKTCLDETYGVQVTLSLRVNAAYDQLGIAQLFKETTGLVDRAKAIRAVIHKDCLNHAIVNAANVLLGNTTATDPPLGFCEPLMYQGMNEVPRIVGGDWFHAMPVEGAVEAIAGLVLTLQFGGARRIQSLDSLD